MFPWKRVVVVLVVLLALVVSAADETQNDNVDNVGEVTGEKSNTVPVEVTGDNPNEVNGKPGNSQTAAPSTVKPDSATKAGNGNGSTGLTDKEGDGSRLSSIMENKGMLMRSFFVFLGITSLVIIYFGVKAWRTRRRKSKSRKYGLITSRGADLEMEPLDQDMDEDDDMTVFEVNGRHK